jgi:hypothetical protein
MNILYDHQIFESPNIGGISRYFAELIKRTPSAQLSLKYSDNIYLQETYFKRFNLLAKDYEYTKFLPYYNFRGKGRLFRYYNRFVLINKNSMELSKMAIEKADFEVFHPTYYNPYFFSSLDSGIFVITVYDMIHELFPNFFAGDIAM